MNKFVLFSFALLWLVGIILTALNSCAMHRYVETNSGLKFNASKVPYALGINISKAKINAVADALEKGFESCYQKYDNDLRQLKVVWSDTVAPSPTTGIINTVVRPGNGKLYNEFLNNGIIYVAWRGKAHRTALAHGIMHYLLLRHERNPDHAHRHKTAWACVDKVNDLLKRKNL